MTRSKPYHEWSRTGFYESSNSAGLIPLYHSGTLLALGNGYRLNQPDDLVERAFLDVQIGCLFKPTTADVTATNNLWMGIGFDVCLSVEAQGSGVVPLPHDTGGPDSRIILTGQLHMVGSGTGSVPDGGYLPEQWAVWAGSFESQGMRLSPTGGVGPAVQASCQVTDGSQMAGGPPFAPASNWRIQAYMRGLFASRIPF